MKILYQTAMLSGFCLLAVSGLYLIHPQEQTVCKAYETYEETVMESHPPLEIASYPGVMAVGDTGRIVMGVCDGWGCWSFESSDPDVVKGNLIAVSPGNATITVSGDDGQTAKVSIQVVENAFEMTPPQKLTYYIGEELDWTGLYVKAIAPNESPYTPKALYDLAELDDNFYSDYKFRIDTAAFDNQKTGIYPITISVNSDKSEFSRCTGTFNVEVIDSELVTETEIETETIAESETEQEKQSLKLTEYTETATLHVNYDGDIVWLSSNTKVATVKDGVVTAVGNGSAVIYAVCGDQRVETPVEVSYDYSLDQTELNLEKGSQYQLGLYSENNHLAYNQIAVWSSSDESVVTVDEVGIITAVSAGTAEITAKAGDVTVSCTVTVKASEQPEISAQQTIQEGKSTVLSISGYDGSVTWVSSDTEIADISADGTLTGIKAGIADIYAMLDNGKTISVKITVTSAESLLGDANLDGNINILDVIVINRAVLGKENLSAEQIKAADVNKNNVPDSVDSLTIMKYIVGLVTALE
ncbi:MAG: Ig-like domain-containing protein [Oscillospiraceae bacterium]|nr:Ig-like domain-containing protein [Oscillospiraceae bacterium]